MLDFSHKRRSLGHCQCALKARWIELLGDFQINFRKIEEKAKIAKKRVIIQGFADHSESIKAASSRVRVLRVH